MTYVEIKTVVATPIRDHKFKIELMNKFSYNNYLLFQRSNTKVFEPSVFC